MSQHTIKKSDNLLNLTQSLLSQNTNSSIQYLKALERLNALPADKVDAMLKSLNYQCIDKLIDLLRGVELGAIPSNIAKPMLDIIKQIQASIEQREQAKQAQNNIQVNISITDRLQDAINKAQTIDAKATKTPIIDKKDADIEQ